MLKSLRSALFRVCAESIGTGVACYVVGTIAYKIGECKGKIKAERKFKEKRTVIITEFVDSDKES